MSDLAVEAEIRRMQLICGLVSVPEVVQWAETALGEVEYDDNLANVAMAADASQSDMVSLLGELATGADRLEAICKVMSSMHGALADDPSLAGEVIHSPPSHNREQVSSSSGRSSNGHGARHSATRSGLSLTDDRAET